MPVGKYKHHSHQLFQKGHKLVGGFKKGHPVYSKRGCFKKGQTCGEKNNNWKGGKSMNYRIKHSPRPKPDICEICRESGLICYDHDHETGKFRGWICDKCNKTLGFAKENPQRLIAIADYIIRHKKHEQDSQKI